MKRGLPQALTVFAVMFSVVVARALTADNPYHTILDRNPFGLNPPPSVSTTNAQPEPPRNVKFNGITQIAGKTRALFTIMGKDPKDPPKYVSLAINEKSDVLEVLNIERSEGQVEVVNSGVKMVLNFKDNGNKGAAPIAVASAPMAAPVPVPVAPVSAPAVYNPGSSVANAGSPVYGGAPSFSNGSYNRGPVQPQGAVFNGNAAASTAIAGLRLGGGSTTHITRDQEPEVDPVQQRLAMLANHARESQAFENGEPMVIPKVIEDSHVAGGIPTNVKRPRLPPPPLPPPPPGMGQYTGE
jgi:hypothetical protein